MLYLLSEKQLNSSLYSGCLVGLPFFHSVWYYWALERLLPMSSQKYFWLYLFYYLLIHNIHKAIWLLKLVVLENESFPPTCFMSIKQVQKSLGIKWAHFENLTFFPDLCWTQSNFFTPRVILGRLLAITSGYHPGKKRTRWLKLNYG